MAVQRWTDEMLDQLAETTKENLDRLTETTKENAEAIKQLREESKATFEAIKQMREESKEQSIRFNAYQQASQWVVNLAFGLLATATITTIISAVFRR